MNTKISDTVFYKFPVLESERLLFRAMETTDAKAMFSIRSNQQVMEYLDMDSHQSETDSLKMIELIQQNFRDKEGISWAIIEKETKQFIGYIGFWRLIKEHVRAEIGYSLHPTVWGKGYMIEAMHVILNFGFTRFGLHSIEANVNRKNKKSMAVLEKMGFVKEAHFRENYFYNGVFIDSIIYSLLESDF